MNPSASLLGGLFRSIEPGWALLDFRDSLLRVSDQRHKMCHDLLPPWEEEDIMLFRLQESSSPETRFVVADRRCDCDRDISSLLTQKGTKKYETAHWRPEREPRAKL